MTNKYKAGDIIIWGDGNNKIIASQIIKVYKKYIINLYYIAKIIL